MYSVTERFLSRSRLYRNLLVVKPGALLVEHVILGKATISIDPP